MQKICEISWVIIKNLINENSACQVTPSKLKCSRKPVRRNEKRFSWSCKLIFLVENRYTLCQEHKKKKFPSLRHEFLPIDPPTTQYYYIRIYENSWLRICYCTISNMFCVRLHSSLHLNCQNCPNLSLTNLQLTFLRFFKNTSVAAA